MNKDIQRFILNLREKNYSLANQSLEQIIEKKIAERIKKSAKKATSDEFFKSKKGEVKNK
jgi:type IV secretory pathway VirB4 component